jgi:hypothetical protein
VRYFPSSEGLERGEAELLASGEVGAAKAEQQAVLGRKVGEGIYGIGSINFDLGA